MQTFFQGLGKAFDLVVAVVHPHRDAGALEVEHLAFDRGAAASGLVQLRSRPGCPGRLLLTPRQRAASAAFSVALGRIAADVLA